MASDDDLEVVWSGKDPLLPPRPSRSTGTWHEQKAEPVKRPYTPRMPRQSPEKEP